MKYKWWMFGLVFLIFAIKGWAMIDPDLGWHLRLGQIIRQTGIPKSDPLSYTMPNYPFVDHEWGINVLMSLGYEKTGMVGLAIIFSGIVTILVLVVSERGDRKWVWPAVLLAGVTWLERAGIRPQIIDWLGLAILVELASQEIRWNRWKWVCVPIILVWVNLHGGFAIGVVTLGVIVVGKWIEKRKVNFGDLFLVAGVVVTTLVTPYGWRSWWEVGMQLSDKMLAKTITEWQPWYSSPQLAFWLLAAMVGSLMWRFKNKFELWRWMLFLGTLIAGMSSLRHMALLAVIAIPIWSKGMELFATELGSDKTKQKRLGEFSGIVMGIAVLIFIVEGGFAMYESFQFREDNFYPKLAVSWLKRNGHPGNVMADYGWGGYLDWKYPEQKVFIDGRMPSWRWFLSQSMPVGNSRYIYKEYLQIESGEAGYQEILKRFNVYTVLLPKRDLLKPKVLISLDLWKQNETHSTFETRLAKMGWKKSYEDEISVIYEKN